MDQEDHPKPEDLDPEQRAWRSQISPHVRRSDLGPAAATAEQLVLIFADRVWGWQLDIAERLVDADDEAGYAALSIAISYFEMIGKHLEGYEGDRDSEKHFVLGFESVFQRAELPADIKRKIAVRLYKGVRCGLYHDGLTVGHIAIGKDLGGGRVFYTQEGVDGQTELVIDPKMLITAVKLHFAAYIGGLLQGPSDTRSRFVRRMLWVDQHSG